MNDKKTSSYNMIKVDSDGFVGEENSKVIRLSEYQERIVENMFITTMPELLEEFRWGMVIQKYLTGEEVANSESK